MRRSCAICVFLTVTGLLGQNADRPRFAKDHVIPYGSGAPRLLTRGQFVSIYGYNLAPRKWCEEPHAQSAPYPLELCGVRVLLSGHPAGLMYVGAFGSKYIKADQINFQVPADSPAEGMVPILVCVGEICSAPVEMEFTSKDILLSLKGEAYVRMPVWIEVEIPMNLRFSYPFSYCPWDFGGYEFEIRRDGRLLATVSKPECSKLRPYSPVSGSSQLPLHLVHEFDSPGAYEIRLTGPLLTADLTKVARTGHSDWTSIIVQPHSEEEREVWLREIGEKAIKLSEWQQSGDVVISLLARPDEKALTTLLPFLRPIGPAGPQRIMFSGNLNEVMHCIAPNALAAFPDAVLKKVIPAEWLKQLQAPSGWCP